MQGVDKDNNGEHVPKLESFETFLVHGNLVNNGYQQVPKVLYTFVSSKQFKQIINVSPHSWTILNNINTKLTFIEIWFTDQNSKPLEIEDNLNITMIIGWTDDNRNIKWGIQFNKEIFKDLVFIFCKEMWW